MNVLVTGSSGLIGGEVVDYFAAKGISVTGIDNNMRADFFGAAGDTSWNRNRLLNKHPKLFKHYDVDIRNRTAISEIIVAVNPDVIVHAAAQPSHDLAASRPFDDFDVNAVGTINMLEATRLHVPRAVFVYMSTNKVYGDAPNEIELVELETRWEYGDNRYEYGIPEGFRIDQSKHSVFGASKVAADIMVQEYGRYFGMHTCCLRGGCLTGPTHCGVELHGFLSYLVKANLEKKKYNIYGYKGKQVRDNIHSFDVACFIDNFVQNPRSGEVYNIGGGKGNSCSIIEAIAIIESITHIPMVTEYTEKNRIGDHICYYSDLRKMTAHYPAWGITKSLRNIIEEIVTSWQDRI